ncbi:oxygenase MpaB family protein [Streptomyces inhibens]|uniref:oxygenase MpaB family protein n=1 Tax=Streptomyces inhibens TaxID=2293571 RepID=UPI0036C8AA4F
MQLWVYGGEGAAEEPPLHRGAGASALYAEWLQVGRIVGIRDHDMPQTIEEFWPYYRKVLANELEATVVVRELIATDRPLPLPDRGPRWLPLLLRLTWPWLGPRFTPFQRFALFPPFASE